MRSNIIIPLLLMTLLLSGYADAKKRKKKAPRPLRTRSDEHVHFERPTTYHHTGEVVILADSEEEARTLSRLHNYTYEGRLSNLLDGQHYLLRMHGEEAHHEHEDERTALARSYETHARLLDQVKWGEAQVRRWHHTRRQRRDPEVDASDPLYDDQWHLHDGGFRHVHANVREAWRAGYSGEGVTVAIVDDGVQYTHADLSRNYNASLSVNFNGSPGGALDPAPGRGDWHGTSVAGVVAASRDDATCGTGVAPHAHIAGVRLISGPVADYQEAQALSHASSSVHVYSNSWGPRDDGTHLGRPGMLTLQTLESMTQTGRGGLGAVFVWAAGNGRAHQDRCDYDGYASSRFTIAVAAIMSDGKYAPYSEPCAALLVSAPSSGKAGHGIVTTDRSGVEGYSDGDCTRVFGGTSAAAPLVAGVVALVLEANPRLTWRDVQHVLVRSAKRVDEDASSWARNAGGFYYSEDYGFGAVDAAAAAELASSWQNLPETDRPHTGARHTLNRAIPDDGSMNEYEEHVVESFVVEHVELVLDITHPKRGELRIRLTAPSGTQVQFADLRADHHSDYPHWTFTATAFWGESSRGVWKIEVRDRIRGTRGTLNHWTLNVYGHTTPPSS